MNWKMEESKNNPIWRTERRKVKKKKERENRASAIYGDYSKRFNIHVSRDPKGKKSETKKVSILEELMAENFSNWIRGVKIRIQNDEQTPIR